MIQLQSSVVQETDCYQQIYHGEYLQCQDTTDLWIPVLSWFDNEPNAVGDNDFNMPEEVPPIRCDCRASGYTAGRTVGQQFMSLLMGWL